MRLAAWFCSHARARASILFRSRSRASTQFRSHVRARASALALSGCLGVALAGLLAPEALAQAEQGDEFSLDEEPTGGDAPAQPAAEEPALLGDEQAIQEEQQPAETYRKSTDPYEDPGESYFFAGAAWRYVRMPSFMLEWFLEAAPSVGSVGSFLGEVGWRKGGFQVTGQVGWMKWDFAGPFQMAKDPEQDTEWLDAKFNFLMFTAAITWSTSFTDWFALEYGLEGGFAFLFGDMIRSEAYKQNGSWRECPAWAPQDGFFNPLWPADMPPSPEQELYCDVPQSEGGVIPPTNDADEIGAHYNVKAEKGIANGGIPRAVPVLGPRLSLRFKPIHQLVIRVDVPLPLAPFGFVGGIAAHYGF